MTTTAGWTPPLALRPAPHYLFIETTTACNLRCRQCHMWMSEEPPGTLTTEEKVALVEKFGGWAERGVVVITGGEPFLKTAEVMALSRRARSFGLSVAVNTNGTCLPEALYDELLTEGPHYLILSLDAPDAATHDWIRGRAGTYDAVLGTMQGLLAARKERHPGSDVRVLVNSILCAETLPKASALIELVRALGADGVMFQALARTFMNRAQGDSFFEQHRPRDMGLVDQVLDALIELRQSDRFLHTEVRDLEWMKLYFRDPDFISEPVCGSAHRNMMVNMFGEQQLCFAMKGLLGGKHLGSVRSVGLRQAWESPEAAQARSVMDACRKNCGMLNCHRREGRL